MALQYIRFTELDSVSSVAAGDIVPVVETVTNLNKKISIGDLNLSLPVGADAAALKSLSANWQGTYVTTQSNSAGWQSVYNTFNSNSANYESAYTTLNSNSGLYNNTIRYPNWDSNYSTTSVNSARWESVYSSYNAVSSTGFNPFVGAGIASNGTQGLVPAPQGGEDNANLAGDGTFHLNVWDQAQPSGAYNTATRYYEPFMVVPSVRNWAYSLANSDQIFLIPFRITHTITVSAIRLQNNSTGAAAGTTAKLAIYKWRTQYVKPRVTDLVSSQFGTLDLTVTGGLMSYATNPVTLVRGLYFVAFAMSGATGTIVGFTDFRTHAQLFAQGDYAQAWPAAGFPNTPILQMTTIGTNYASLWPASLSPSSSSIYNITQVDAATPMVHLIGTP